MDEKCSKCLMKYHKRTWKDRKQIGKGKSELVQLSEEELKIARMYYQDETNRYAIELDRREEIEREAKEKARNYRKAKINDCCFQCKRYNRSEETCALHSNSYNYFWICDDYEERNKEATWN